MASILPQVRLKAKHTPFPYLTNMNEPNTLLPQLETVRSPIVPIIAGTLRTITRKRPKET
jgi:hypothetical protein